MAPFAPSYRSEEDLAVDTKRAEAILHELARELLLVPLAHRLHLRALALKREVAHWPEACPTEAERQETIDDLLELQKLVTEERRRA